METKRLQVDPNSPGLRDLRQNPERKFFWPSFKCESDNVFVGPAGHFQTREEAQEAADGPLGLMGILYGFEPYEVREYSWNDLQREDVIPTPMHGAQAWVVEGPITQKYRQRRAIA